MHIEKCLKRHRLAYLVYYHMYKVLIKIKDFLRLLY